MKHRQRHNRDREVVNIGLRFVFACEKLEVQPRQLAIAFLIHTTNRMTNSSISTVLSIPRSSVRRYTKSLEANGLLVKRQDGLAFTEEFNAWMCQLCEHFIPLVAGDPIQDEQFLTDLLQHQNSLALGFKRNLRAHDLIKHKF